MVILIAKELWLSWIFQQLFNLSIIQLSQVSRLNKHENIGFLLNGGVVKFILNPRCWTREIFYLFKLQICDEFIELSNPTWLNTWSNSTFSYFKHFPLSGQRSLLNSVLGNTSKVPGSMNQPSNKMISISQVCQWHLLVISFYLLWRIFLTCLSALRVPSSGGHHRYGRRPRNLSAGKEWPDWLISWPDMGEFA